MPHCTGLYQWQDRLATFFPDLPATRRRCLAVVSFGIVLARSALLNQVVLELSVASRQSFNTVRQSVRTLYRPGQDKQGEDCSFDYTACFAGLVRWATAGFTDRRLALAIDATNLGNRFTILAVSVVFGGCAVPVAWHVQKADAKGSWNAHWGRLLGLLRTALGEEWQVLVLSDRGLESGDLFGAITALGWHPLMRVKKGGHFRPDGWTRGWPLSRFAGQVGRRWRGRGVAWPSTGGLGCMLLACWEAGHEDAWLILTDLGAHSVAAVWYAWRGWIEQGFRDLKSDGWELSKTRMTDPQRVGRWWAAGALALLWVVEAGEQGRRLRIPATRTHVGEGKAAVTSLFALGLAWLGEQLGRGVVPRLRRLAQPDWPADTTASDLLKEEDWVAQHQKLPF